MPRRNGTDKLCEGRGCDSPAKNQPKLMVNHEPLFWARLCDRCTEKLREACDSMVERRYDPKAGYQPKEDS